MKRSKISLSNYKLTTMDMGWLYPINWFEVIPGDSVQQTTSALVRVSPLNTPIMHPVRVRIHHWYIPNRVIWPNFPDFITGGEDGLDSTTHPYIDIGTVAEGDLADYLGIPPAAYTGVDVNALPFRAYIEIYNQAYRDTELNGLVARANADGSDATTSTSLQRVKWEKDYFTTLRGEPQLGAGATIPVSGVPDFEIEDLRLGLAIQRYEEARQRHGGRYKDYLQMLGVKSSDARLQEPEYLGGGRNTIQFSEVLSTDGTNTGDLYGHGIGAMRTNRYRRFFEEHGIVMTLMSVVPKTMYCNALHRSWSRQVKEDYYTRELSTIGEQEVLNKELYSEHTTPDGVLGYGPRYDEYRSLPSQVSGEFRSTLDTWHMGRVFTSDPALNSALINCNPTDRVYKSTSTNQLMVMVQNSIQARRPMVRIPRPRTF